MEAITINTEKLFDLDNINSFAKEWKEAARGNKVLAYYCSHMPEEILYAADILPYRLSGTGVTDDSQAETYMSPFSCSFCRACFQKFLDGSYDFLDGFVASDGCLQPQRVFDNWKFYVRKEDQFVHQFNAPRVYDESALGMYRREMLDLKTQLRDSATM